MELVLVIGFGHTCCHVAPYNVQSSQKIPMKNGIMASVPNIDLIIAFYEVSLNCNQYKISIGKKSVYKPFCV